MAFQNVVGSHLNPHKGILDLLAGQIMKSLLTEEITTGPSGDNRSSDISALRRSDGCPCPLCDALRENS